MSTDLADFIRDAPLSDTHEHLNTEAVYLNSPPDVLFDLFNNYVTADLVVAGADPEAVKRLVNPEAAGQNVAARFAAVRDAWEACRFTGYGEAVRRIAQDLYGIAGITPEALEAAQPRAVELRRPGKRLEVLRKAGIDHVQTDDFRWEVEPDASGPEFFLYDISWVGFCNGDVDAAGLEKQTGVTVRSLESLREAMAALFAKYAPLAIAVKSQHAYNRTLRWEERDEADVARALEKALAGATLGEGERLTLGDWCWARGAELAAEHNLPFKIHTGYYAGHGYMPVDRIRAGHLWQLLGWFPKTRFVLMHIAYPYSEELVALAKQYPNAYVDLCWAWSINPRASEEFVRRFIHAVPANKLFGFGGDSFWPWASAAYAHQARAGLTRALEAEAADGLLTERDAIGLAARFLGENQRACFDLEGTRRAIREVTGSVTATQ